MASAWAPRDRKKNSSRICSQLFCCCKYFSVTQACLQKFINREPIPQGIRGETGRAPVMSVLAVQRDSSTKRAVQYTSYTSSLPSFCVFTTPTTSKTRSYCSHVLFGCTAVFTNRTVCTKCVGCPFPIFLNDSRDDTQTRYHPYCIGRWSR